MCTRALTSVEEMRLELRRKGLTFIQIFSFLHVFTYLVKETPSPMIKHRFSPSYLEFEGADMN